MSLWGNNRPLSTVSNASRSPLHLRVFLASPGDVADERVLALRVLALRVLEELQYDPLLRGKITAETVAWDRPGAGTPMLATLTPQEAIKQDSCSPVLLGFSLHTAEQILFPNRQSIVVCNLQQLRTVHDHREPQRP